MIKDLSSRVGGGVFLWGEGQNFSDGLSGWAFFIGSERGPDFFHAVKGGDQNFPHTFGIMQGLRILASS